MEFRNPTYTATGLIDCEVNHPVYGWIPFTASPDDPEPSGRAIYAAALAAGPGQYVAPEIVTPVPESVQRLQARIILGRATLADGALTIHAARQTPSLLTQADAICTQAGGEVAEAWANLVILRRDSPMLNGTQQAPGLAQAIGLTSAHLDTLFQAAARVAL